MIGKEVCKADTAQDYWLIDLRLDYTASNTFGDTITVNGITYNHMVKTTGLLPQFHVVGKKIHSIVVFQPQKYRRLDVRSQAQ